MTSTPPIPTQSVRFEAELICWRRIPLNTLADTDFCIRSNSRFFRWSRAEDLAIRTIAWPSDGQPASALLLLGDVIIVSQWPMLHFDHVAFWPRWPREAWLPKYRHISHAQLKLVLVWSQFLLKFRRGMCVSIYSTERPFPVCGLKPSVARKEEQNKRLSLEWRSKISLAAVL